MRRCAEGWLANYLKVIIGDLGYRMFDFGFGFM